MTQSQEKAIMTARNYLQSSRRMLDGAMYGDISNQLSDAEFRKVREGYDLICKAIDALP